LRHRSPFLGDTGLSLHEEASRCPKRADAARLPRNSPNPAAVPCAA
jgi:hypothetical protein